MAKRPLNDSLPVQLPAEPTPGGHHLQSVVERWSDEPALDTAVVRARAVVDRIAPAGPARQALRGSWLGHALHPLLTDLPIGSWTSAMVLDLVGGRSARPAARRLVALGLLTTPPTALTGAAEWADADVPSQRLGLVHAVANSAAFLLYLRSYQLRRRERHLRGVLYGLAGGTAATVGGYLGGHLAFHRGLGVAGGGQSGVSDAPASATAAAGAPVGPSGTATAPEGDPAAALTDAPPPSPVSAD